MGVEIITIVKNGQQLKVKRASNQGKKQEIDISTFINSIEEGHTFFLIHQGLIDDEIGQENFNNIIKPAIEQKVRYIVVHSGKGLPPGARAK